MRFVSPSAPAGFASVMALTLTLALTNIVCCSGSTSPSDAQAAPDPDQGTGEPFFGDEPADVLIVREVFDDYDYVDSYWGTPAFAGSGSPHHWDAGPGDDSHFALPTPGHGGTGKSLKLYYGHDYETNFQVTYPAINTPDHIFHQVWFKTSVGWDPGGGGTGLKGWMFEMSSGPLRLEVGPSRYGAEHDGLTHFGGFGRPEITWQASGHVEGFEAGYVWPGRHNDSEGPPWLGRSGIPWPNGFADGSWHRYTFEMVSAGSNQGVRAWFDGVLVWDDFNMGHQYPKATLYKFWGNDWGGVLPNGTIEFDDLVIWHR
jgi:hypothetical protein